MTDEEPEEVDGKFPCRVEGCRFILKMTEDGLSCPTHGIQSIPEYLVDEDRGYDSKQVYLEDFGVSGGSP